MMVSDSTCALVAVGRNATRIASNNEEAVPWHPNDKGDSPSMGTNV